MTTNQKDDRISFVAFISIIAMGLLLMLVKNDYAQITGFMLILLWIVREHHKISRA